MAPFPPGSTHTLVPMSVTISSLWRTAHSFLYKFSSFLDIKTLFKTAALKMLPSYPNFPYSHCSLMLNSYWFKGVRNQLVFSQKSFHERLVPIFKGFQKLFSLAIIADFYAKFVHFWKIINMGTGGLQKLLWLHKQLLWKLSDIITVFIEAVSEYIFWFLRNYKFKKKVENHNRSYMRYRTDIIS